MASPVSKSFSGDIKKSAPKQCVVNAGTASEICMLVLLWCTSQTVAKTICNLSMLLINKQIILGL